MASPLPTNVRAALDRLSMSLTSGVIMLCGFPASGKSSAARYLETKLNALVLDKDSFAPSLEESVMSELTGDPYDKDSDIYRRVVNPYICEALVTHGLRAGMRQLVILDAPFVDYVQSAVDRGISVAEFISTKIDIPVKVTTVWFASSPDEIRRRMVGRGAVRDAYKLDNWEIYQSKVLEAKVVDVVEEAVDFVIVN